MPVSQAVCAQVVIAAAIGVPQRFYAAFAQWLAAHGYAVTTFDYRGYAESLHGPLRQARADLRDWAADCAAVAQHARAQAPGLPVLWVGHSVGAQLPGMSAQPLPIDGMLCVASGSGYWRDNAPPTRRKVLLWWYGIAPLLTALHGCLPGRRWGLVGDLPAGVLWQWRQWCLHPNYGIGVVGEPLRTAYAAARYPLHAVHVPAGRIGHFGFFRAEMEGALWPRALAVLEHWRDRAQAMTPRGQPYPERRSTVTKMDPGAGSPQPGQGELFSETACYEHPASP